MAGPRLKGQLTVGKARIGEPEAKGEGRPLALALQVPVAMPEVVGDALGPRIKGRQVLWGCGHRIGHAAAR